VKPQASAQPNLNSTYDAAEGAAASAAAAAPEQDPVRAFTALLTGEDTAETL